MIIYPIAIILILLIAFFVVWRRAYFVEKVGIVPDQPEGFLQSEERDVDPERGTQIQEKKKFSIFHFKKKGEPEVMLEKTQDPLMEKAEELFFKKQYISAEKWYLEVIKKDPRNPKIYSRLGLIYISQKNYKDAISCLEEANKLEPTVASRYFNLSFANNEEGNRKEALDSARKAIRLDPQNPKYKNWFNELRSRPF